VISRFLEAPAYRTPRSISTLTGNKLSPPVHFLWFLYAGAPIPVANLWQVSSEEIVARRACSRDAKWRLGGEIHGSKKGSTPEKEAAK
jgi:hypothetical protein